jgi:lysozyme
MKPSQKCSDLVKQFEGLRLTAYQRQGDLPTIGYGHTAGVKLGDRITREQADAFLAVDLEASGAFVSEIVTVPLTQNQFDALTSFDFNLGGERLANSTLLYELNHRNYAGAADQFLYWKYGPGEDGKLVILPGLVKRREAERAMFLGTE